MTEKKLDILVDVQSLNAEQIANVQRSMQELGITTDQLSDRMQAAMQDVQRTAAPLQEEAKSASGAAGALGGLAQQHDEVSRSAMSVTHGMSNLQNVLSNAMVNASMGGNAFSNLAWGLMFSPNSAAMAMTGVTTAAYALVQGFVAAQQETEHLASRAMELSQANHISVQEGEALAPVLDALGIKNNNLSKAMDEAVAKTGSLAAVQQLEGEAAVRGAVVTDQQVMAMLRQQDAAAKLSLEWAGLSNRIGGGIDVQTRAEDALAKLLSSNFDQWAALRTLIFGEAQAHDAASVAARNHAEQERLLNDRLRATSDAVNGAQQSALRVEQANLSVSQALSNLTNVENAHVDVARKESEAAQRVTIDQETLSEAVKKHGAASLEAQRASLALEQAQDALNKVTESGSHEAFDLAAAQDEAKSTILAVADAAGQNYDAQVRQAGAISSAAARADAQVAALKGVEDKLAPDSPLRVWLDQYIAQLSTIPASKTTTITEVHQTIVSQQGANAPGFASEEGGVFTRPTWTLVAESRPEAIVPLQPGNTAPGASPLPSGLAGQDTPIVLDVTMLLDEEVLARFVERRTGRSVGRLFA